MCGWSAKNVLIRGWTKGLKLPIWRVRVAENQRLAGFWTRWLTRDVGPAYKPGPFGSEWNWLGGRAL